MPFTAPQEERPGKTQISAAEIQHDQVNARDTVEMVHPVAELLESSLLREGRHINDEFHLATPALRGLAVSLKFGDDVLPHYPDDVAHVPLVMVQEPADS